MLKIKIIASFLFLASTTAAFAAETCQAPLAPTLPQNGAVISHDQLMAAADQVSAFTKANTVYKTCLDVIITKPTSVSRAEWRSALKSYNETAPAEQAVWNSYQKVSDDWVAANQAKKSK
jgi:hypothetical protein